MGGTAGGAAQVGLGGLQILESRNVAKAQKRAAEFEARQLEYNAELIGIQKEEIVKQSGKAQHKRHTQTKQMVGEQKAALAAQGISLDSEVVGLLEDQERQFGLEDVQTIKNNAWRETMGLEIEQSDLRTQAKSTRLSGKESARQSLVTGGLGGLSSMAGGFRDMDFGGFEKVETKPKGKK